MDINGKILTGWQLCDTYNYVANNEGVNVALELLKYQGVNVKPVLINPKNYCCKTCRFWKSMKNASFAHCINPLSPEYSDYVLICQTCYCSEWAISRSAIEQGIENLI